MNKKIFGSGMVAVVATITFCNISTSAADIVDEINITVPSSCSLSGTNLIHTANMENGQYKDNIGSANISAFCNDPNGFSIYAIGYTEDTYGNNKMHDPNLDTTHDINTGKYVNGTTTNSTWSMKLTPVTGPYAPTIRNDSTYNYTNYEVVPSEYTKVAYSSAATETGNGATGSNFTTSYAVFVSQSQNAGSYTGKVKFTLVHPENETPAQPQPCEAGKICYHANTTSIEGQMGDQDATNSTETTLWASNFSRTGYGFAGWNDKFDYSGNYYGPNETITAPADVETNGLSLYAVWIKSAGSIQNWNGCNSLTSGATTALTDERDNNTYAVAKLADNKCWMIENLRLENTGAHNTDGSLAQGYNSSFIGLADPESANFNSNGVANSLYSTDGSTTAPAITGSNTGYRFPRYNNNNTSSRQSSSGYSTSGNTYSMGNYYTWHAAIADTTYYNTRNQSIENTSLCPAGWRLPKGGQTTVNTTADFYILGKALMDDQEPDQNATDGYGYYGNTLTNTAGDTATKAFRKYPNNFLYSGLFNGSSANYRGSGGYYWSSTAYGNRGSYNLYLYSSGVYPGTDNYNKLRGYAIRCTLGS